MSERELVIAAFGRLARPIMLKWLTRRSCIASSRVAIECLRAFDVRSRAVPVRFVLRVDERKLAYTSGLSPAERAHAEKTSSTFEDLPSQSGGGWNGHVVVCSGRFLIDPSFDQGLAAFTEAGHQIEDTPRVLVLPLGRQIGPSFLVEVKAVLDDGTGIAVEYATLPDWSFKQAPAWELDHIQPIINEIVEKMKEELL